MFNSVISSKTKKENELIKKKQEEDQKEYIEYLEIQNEQQQGEIRQLKEEKIDLEDKMLSTDLELKKKDSSLEAKNEEIIQLQKDHKEEIAELNFKLNNEKDLNKELLVVRSDFLKQNAFKRLMKVEPESSKAIGNMLKELPENEVEVEPKPSEETESTASSKE